LKKYMKEMKIMVDFYHLLVDNITRKL
jgi:hypothetical protein